MLTKRKFHQHTILNLCGNHIPFALLDYFLKDKCSSYCKQYNITSLSRRLMMFVCIKCLTFPPSSMPDHYLSSLPIEHTLYDIVASITNTLADCLENIQIVYVGMYHPRFRSGSRMVVVLISHCGNRYSNETFPMCYAPSTCFPRIPCA